MYYGAQRSYIVQYFRTTKYCRTYTKWHFDKGYIYPKKAMLQVYQSLKPHLNLCQFKITSLVLQKKLAVEQDPAEPSVLRQLNRAH
jgi:hypothetical protein